MPSRCAEHVCRFVEYASLQYRSRAFHVGSPSAGAGNRHRGHVATQQHVELKVSLLRSARFCKDVDRRPGLWWRIVRNVSALYPPVTMMLGVKACFAAGSDLLHMFAITSGPRLPRYTPGSPMWLPMVAHDSFLESNVGFKDETGDSLADR